MAEAAAEAAASAAAVIAAVAAEREAAAVVVLVSCDALLDNRLVLQSVVPVTGPRARLAMPASRNPATALFPALDEMRNGC